MPHRGTARAGRNVLNRPNVKTKRNIDVVNRAVFHHGERTFERFFGRLKQNLERTFLTLSASSAAAVKTMALWES